MSRKMSRRDVEALESLGSFEVSASISEAATSRLVLDKILNVSVLSWSRLRRSRAHPWWKV